MGQVAQFAVALLCLVERLAEQRLDLPTNGYRIIASAFRAAP